MPKRNVKLKCISNSGREAELTLNKVYDAVIGENELDKDELFARIIENDKHSSWCYYTDRFEEVTND